VASLRIRVQKRLISFLVIAFILVLIVLVVHGMVDSISPDYPPDTSIQFHADNVTFNCTVTLNASTYNITNVTLWTNFTGTWQENISNGSDTINTFPDGGRINLTWPAPVPDGSFVWACYAYDDTGEPGNFSQNYTLFIDSKSPTDINFTGVGVNGTISANLTPVFTWNQTTELSFINYTILIATNESFDDITAINFTAVTTVISNTTLIIGIDTPSMFAENTVYFIQVRAYENDSAAPYRSSNINYVNSTEYWQYNAGTLPVMLISYPADDNYTNHENLTFDFQVTDSYFDNCSLMLDGIVNLTNISDSASYSGTFGTEGYTESFTVYVNHTLEGIHEWNITCVDTYGNSNTTTTRNLSVDFTHPYVVNATPYNESANVSVSTNIIINFSESMSTDTISTSTLSLKKKGEAIAVNGLFSFNSSKMLATFDPYLTLDPNITYEVNVSTLVTDRAGNNMSNDYIFNFTTSLQDTDGNGTPDVYDLDDDNDGFTDSDDFINGNESNINTNMGTSINITINNTDNLSYFNGTYEIRIFNGSLLRLNLSYTFSNTTHVDFTNITLLIDENSSMPSVVIHGLTLQTNMTKAVYLYNMTGHYQGVYIRDLPTVESVYDLSANCNETGEKWITCPGAYGNYTCNATGSTWKVSGLSHSAVAGVNDTFPPVITSLTITQNATINASTVNITVMTNENSTCKYGTTDAAYGSLSWTMTYTGTRHLGQRSYTSQGTTYTYYIRCQDIFGNTMSTSRSQSVTISFASTDSGDDDSGSSGGGGGGSTIASDAGDTYSRFWQSLTQGSTEFSVTKTAIGIRKISFSLSQQASNSEIKITALDDEPASISAAPSGTVNQYLKIVTENLPQGSLSGIKMRFRVPSVWLDDNNIPTSNIALYRYSGSTWVKLPTTKKETSDGYVYYEASSVSFSYFGIVGIEPEATTTTLAPVSEPETTDNMSDVTGAAAADAQQNATGQLPQGLSIYTWIFYVIIFVVGLGGGVFIYVKREDLKGMLKKKETDEDVLEEAKDVAGETTDAGKSSDEGLGPDLESAETRGEQAQEEVEKPKEKKEDWEM